LKNSLENYLKDPSNTLNSEFFLDSIGKEYLKSSKKVMLFNFELFSPLGTENEIESFFYWKEYFLNEH